MTVHPIHPEGLGDDTRPHDKHAERVVIGAILGHDALEQYGGLLESSTFYVPAHAAIFDAAFEVAGRDEPVNDITVAAQLSTIRTPGKSARNQLAAIGGYSKLKEFIQDVPGVGTVGHFVRTIAEHAARRDTIAEGHRLVAGASVPGGSLADLHRTHIEAIEHIRANAGNEGQHGSRMVAGGGFILDAPDHPPALWGHGDQILWAEGEALMIVGPAGVGKTTLVGQIVRARLGLAKKVLDLPVAPGRKRVLYLAMDRPPQIARSLARLFGPEDRRVLDENLIIWKGPPPRDIAQHPETLAEMCRDARADTVIVDSLKDAARKLSDDDTGSGYNRARQQALVEGVQVVELHHQRKAGAENKKPNTLDDIYGSTWLPAGAGSVLLLWGTAGDAVVELHHRKQPADEVGPFKILHDHLTGTSHVYDETDVWSMANASPNGVSAVEVARVLFGNVEPSPNEVEKARRKLDALVPDRLHKSPTSGGRGGRGQAARYFAVVADGDGSTP